jgi:hypothetical protein
MTAKNYYRIKVTQGSWKDPCPCYFDNFYKDCFKKSKERNWNIDIVVEHELRPHGLLVKTETQGWYLRWDDEKYHNMFLLKWS